MNVDKINVDSVNIDFVNIEQTLRECAPAVVGALTRRFGDFADAEDATQEALIAAAVHWPGDGIPDNPRAWLIQTGSRKLLNQWRSDQARRHREALAAREPSPDASDVDDTLTVLFMCCHPALTDASAIALTLRAFGGLTTAEIAKAFLVPEATMAQRISRAKQQIRRSGRPFQRPGPAEFRQRLRAVLHVLYLTFNHWYLTSTGPADAIRLARLVHEKLPEHGEVAGLLALMLLTDARRPARTTADGELIPLAEQDRSLWDRALIAEGTAILNRAFGRGPVGEYQLQAAIAALHDRAPRAEDTDWPQILALYAHLERLTGNPIVALNRAVAVAMVHGPEEGLRQLRELDTKLAGNHRLVAVRAHLLEIAGDHAGALEQYRVAAARATSLLERRYLTTKAARLFRVGP
jgi:RNA polymerase sigma factor (sigma-70 family)